MERREEEQLEDLEPADDEAEEVTGGGDKQPYLTYSLNTATISGSTSPPPRQP
jgi:hypothetical protein